MPLLISYHGFGIYVYRYLRTQYQGGDIYFHLIRSKDRCANCSSFQVIQMGFKIRLLRTLPIGRRRVFLVIKMRRFRCQDCGRILFKDLGIADRKKHYTRALERYVMDLCMRMTIRDISELTGLHRSTVKAIDRGRLRDNLPSSSLISLKFLVKKLIAQEKFEVKSDMNRLIPPHQIGGVMCTAYHFI